MRSIVGKSTNSQAIDSKSVGSKSTGAKLIAALLIAGFLASTLAIAAPAHAAAAEHAVVLELDGAIGPPAADYVTRELNAVKPNAVGLVILRINTPGGLMNSMRKIVSAILASPVPVAAFVAPSGARAASAGTYIAYACAIAAMAPGTNIGAATPVQLGRSNPLPPADQKERNGQEQSGDAETHKIVNDAVAYIRSLAALNHRNADWAEQAVRTAASVPATEALKLNVIDVIAADDGDLLHQIDGRTVMVAGNPMRLATAGLAVEHRPPGWRTALLEILTDPDVAFILMLVGVCGLILEFFSPGAVAPGLIGTIALLLALYGLAFIPIDYAGAALVIFGIALMVAEAHIGAFGALGAGGIAAFVIGALMMFPSRAPGFALSGGVIIGAAIGIAAVLLLVLAALLRSHRRPIATGGEALIGSEGETVFWQGEDGRVRVKGEIWRARSARPLAAGARVKVIGRDGLVLHVEAVG